MVPTTIPATTITAHKFRLHTSSKCPKEPAAALLVYQVLSARISYTLDAQQSPCREQRDKAIREKTDVLVSRDRKDIKQCSSTVDLQSFVDGKRACMHTPCDPCMHTPCDPNGFHHLERPHAIFRIIAVKLYREPI